MSKGKIVSIRCGHALHEVCFQNYIKHTFKCPICKKSVYEPDEFADELDDYITSWPMPEDYKDTKMTIICNECLIETSVPFHIAGGKCTKCGSYNTTRTKNPELDRIEAELQEKKRKEAAAAVGAAEDGEEDDGEDGDSAVALVPAGEAVVPSDSDLIQKEVEGAQVVQEEKSDGTVHPKVVSKAKIRWDPPKNFI